MRPWADGSGKNLSFPSKFVCDFALALEEQGLFEALQLLNQGSIYRFTGVYQFEKPDWVRSVVLFDRKNPDLRIGADVPWKDSYCMMTANDGKSCEIADSLTDPRLKKHTAREVVRAYCAVLLRYSDGRSLGTLCHFDLKPQLVPPGTFESLDAVRPALEQFLCAGVNCSQGKRVIAGQ
ncbi:MAG: luxQ 8 [Acidobacteriales bacterium]|nr:luxQ 8 [Terriglobales bacterium]